tara:strand:+ start:15418 stop:16266 length:849 start_codon:yes stop_codon:yes gene_type:complete
MAEGIGGLFNLIKSRMTDDEGLFQGGHQGRMLGRVRDAWDKNVARNMGDTGNLAGQVQPSNMGYNRPVKDTRPDKFLNPFTWGNQSDPGSKAGDPGFKQANSWIKNFNPQDKNDVLKIQKMFGLEEDGIFGPKTLAAVRQFQGNRDGTKKDSFGFGVGRKLKSNLEKGYLHPEGWIADDVPVIGSKKKFNEFVNQTVPTAVGGKNYAAGNEGWIPDKWTGGMPTKKALSQLYNSFFGPSNPTQAPQQNNQKVLAPQHRAGFGTTPLNQLMNWNDDDTYSDIG